MIQNHNDRYWEKRLGIHTCGDDESVSDRHHSPYQPTPYRVLERIVDHHLIKKSDLIIDYGCGKGRVGIFMSKEIGCKSIGIEYDPCLYAAAVANAASNDLIHFELCSAESYIVPSTANCFYFFNPFSLVILKRVIRKINKSLEAFPRQVRLIFYFPVEETDFLLFEGFHLENEIDCRDLFHTTDNRERILVFENEMNADP